MTDNSVFEWSEEERERAAAVLETDARYFNEKHASTTVVPPTECSRWRQEVKADGGTPVGVDAEYTTSTVENHVQGDCNHDPREVGVPARYDNQAGEWIACRVISAGTDPSNLRVYHTRVCKVFPENGVRVLDGLDCVRQKWRECRECRGRVPMAGPIPEK